MRLADHPAEVFLPIASRKPPGSTIHEWQREVSAEWRQLGIDRQAAFKREERATARAAADAAPLRQQVDLLSLERKCMGFADTRSPLAKKNFEKVVRSELGLSDGQPVGGFKRYVEPLRKRFMDSLYVADDGPPIYCRCVC